MTLSEVTKLENLAMNLRDAHARTKEVKEQLELHRKAFEEARERVSAAYAKENELHAAIMKLINGD